MELTPKFKCNDITIDKITKNISIIKNVNYDSYTILWLKKNPSKYINKYYYNEYETNKVLLNNIARILYG